LAFEDKVSAPVPVLVDYIYRSVEKWKRQQYQAKRQQEQRAARPEQRPLSRVAGTLCTPEDLEEFK
jgi:hypothetical protein